MNDFVDLNASLVEKDETAAPIRREFVITATTLQELNTEQELLAQYKRAATLMHDIEYKEDIPLSQKASALNSISAILATITKAQTDLYNAERLKKLEGVLIDVLREYPEVQKSFMTRYAEALDVR